MKTTYDKQADALYIYFTSGKSVTKTEEVKEDIMVDYDDDGSLIGLEILDASKKLSKQTLTSILRDSSK